MSQPSPERTHQSAEEKAPQLSKIEMEKKEAFDKVMDKFEAKHAEIVELKKTAFFSASERAKERGYTPDPAMNDVSILHTASEEILKELRGIEHRKEFAAATLEDMIHEYENFTDRFLKIKRNYPEITERLGKLDPVLAMVGNTNQSANDEKFLVNVSNKSASA